MEEIYITKNLNLAAVLCCFPSDIRFLGTEKVHNEFVFKFSPLKQAQTIVQKYFSGEISISPRELFARQKDLKDLIFNSRPRI
ncbi:MAG: hypothetical protein AAB553_05895 [Patescibacteria group bacterium]